MHNFEYRQGELYCEQVPVSQIAKQVGTRCYIYSHATLIRHIRAYDSAFKNVPHLIAFAMKANSNLAILRLMAKEGSGVDIVSGGELFRALKAGVAPSSSRRPCVRRCRPARHPWRAGPRHLRRRRLRPGRRSIRSKSSRFWDARAETSAAGCSSSRRHGRRPSPRWDIRCCRPWAS